MAPINLPDGTEVSEVILPDGSTASEVIAPDGTTVFGAIPDSDLYYAVDEGSGSTLIDAIGNRDGSITGGTWVSDGNFEGGYYLELDATDDLVDVPNTLLSSSRDFTIAITLTTDSSFDVAERRCLFHFGDGSAGFTLIRDDSRNFVVDSYNGSSRIDTVSGSEPTPPYTVRLMVRYDVSASDLQLFVDATEQTGSTQSKADADDLFRLGADYNGNRHLGAGIDTPTVWDDQLADPQADYDRQPWS